MEPSHAAPRQRSYRQRLIRDIIARYVVGAGGIGVIIAICLIFFYLLVEVLPLFGGASITPLASYPLPEKPGTTLSVTLEDQGLMGARVLQTGQVIFFDTRSGKTVKTFDLPIPAGQSISHLHKTESSIDLNAVDDKKQNRELYLVGLSNGDLIVFSHYYSVTHPADTERALPQRVLTPQLEYPFGNKPVRLADNQAALTKITGEYTNDALTVVSLSATGTLRSTHFEKSSTLEDAPVAYEIRHQTLAELPTPSVRALLLSKDLRSLYLVDAYNGLSYYVLGDTHAKLVQHLPSVTGGAYVSVARLMNGGISLLLGDSVGRVSQWMPVRDKQNSFHLEKIREFKLGNAPIEDLSTEYGRKGFAIINQDGTVALAHTTANQIVFKQNLKINDMQKVFLGPRANTLFILDKKNQAHLFHVKNDHPEVSWASLWSKVWYESYPEPSYTWQSTSGTGDYEPKYSFVPLAFGTLKGAFYAMLISVPLAIMAAIYTAQFMTTRMRRIVKPGIEIMEALPTVILGFIAGLWLAPLVEHNLAGVFLLLIAIPGFILGFGYLWQTRMPASLRHRFPEGWESILLIPVVILCSWFTFSILGPLCEHWFFNGSMSAWLRQGLDIPYSQRNAVIVGLVMGFAIIPIIFSIAEDALFAVPKHLIQGSLALGATSWQTLTRVVLLTASPGIFSAVMIGFGRAIGETMIVLMATGNTPITDLNPFEGMRTLSANIAVELPESAEHSTHFRLLFLAALLLFVFTFVFNTLAEIVRHRLRKKYSSL